jgi:hypothetical protein
MPTNMDTSKLFKDEGRAARKAQAARDEASFDKSLGQPAPRPAPKSQPAPPKNPGSKPEPESGGLRE